MFSRPTRSYSRRGFFYESEKKLFSKTEMRTRVGTDLKILERLLSIEATHKPLQTRRKADRQRRYGIWSYVKANGTSNGDLDDISTINNSDDRQWTRRETRNDGHERRRWNSVEQSIIPLDLHQQNTKYPAKNEDTAYAEPAEKPLRLPPMLLPPIYTVKPAPLHPRLLLTPTYHRGPIRESEWEELKECRYLRQGLSKFKNKTVNQSV